MIDQLLRFVPLTHRKAYLELLNNVPFYVRTICVVGDSGSVVGHLLKRRPDNRVFGVVHRSIALAASRETLDGVSMASSRFGTTPVEELDAVILIDLEENSGPALDVLRRMAERLSSTCHVIALFGDPNLGRPDATSALAEIRARIEARLVDLNFKVREAWSVDKENTSGAKLSVASLVLAVSRAYDPIKHARDLVSKGEPALGYAVVDGIPRGSSVAQEKRVAAFAERLKTISAWMEADPDSDVSHKLAAAQESFYVVTDVRPTEPAAYQEMARCWEKAGDHDMARRLLRSIQFGVPDVSTQHQLGQIPDIETVTARVEDVPLWEMKAPFRVLFLMNPRPHYGIDVLYDGLCECLGDENVVDYPYKPWLHGKISDAYKQYPCQFDRDGSLLTFEALLQHLDAETFDLILYADIEGDISNDEMVTVMQRAKNCPVAIVDGTDEFTDFQSRVSECLQFDNFTAYFKREKHRIIDYGPKSYPLPFAYDMGKAVENVDSNRPDGSFFWAGHRSFGIRRLYLDVLESRYGYDLDVKYSPDVYIQRIRESLIGLNCFGMGFDTVRYWELPAQGCLLLSERLPIEIPFDFEDGSQAVFFDDLPTLVEKLDHYQAHPEKARSIAAAGHAHYLQYHTNGARARQLLGWIGTLLGS